MGVECRFKGVASEIWQGDALQVAKLVPDDSCTLAIVDGPYAMGIGPAWDSMTVDELPEWYAPHLAEVDRILQPSATLYVWNRAPGWAALHPHLLAAGWVFRSLIHWPKLDSRALMGARPGGVKYWVDLTEVCGFYVRGSPRPWFKCPTGIGNIWQHQRIQRGDRLTGSDGRKIHACQKPVLFARRMLESSMRPGETAWVPFGGTCREALAAELIAKANPDEARRVIVAEINADGPDYIGAAVRQIRGQGNRPATDGQVGLFAV